MPSTRTSVHVRKRLVAASGILALAFVAGCSGTETSDAAVFSDEIDELVEVFLDNTDREGDVRAILVYDDGVPLYERYIDASADDYFEIRSITKSVTSTLVGIAIDEGLISNTDATLAELLPSHAAPLSADVADIRLHDVLTHTAGFAPAEVDGTFEYWLTPEWMDAILADRAERGPGDGSFAYSDAGAHVLAGIVAEATGTSVLDFARTRLFDELEIPSEPAWSDVAVLNDDVVRDYEAADFAWATDPQGIHEGASTLKLRPQDLARLGLLFAQDGEWNGRQIVSSEWVEAALSGWAPTEWADFPSYGYQWWIAEDDVRCATGQGGQAVCIDPADDAVVVIASSIDLFDDTRLITGMNVTGALTVSGLILGLLDR